MTLSTRLRLYIVTDVHPVVPKHQDVIGSWIRTPNPSVMFRVSCERMPAVREDLLRFFHGDLATLVCLCPVTPADFTRQIDSLLQTGTVVNLELKNVNHVPRPARQENTVISSTNVKLQDASKVLIIVTGVVTHVGCIAPHMQ